MLLSSIGCTQLRSQRQNNLVDTSIKVSLLRPRVECSRVRAGYKGINGKYSAQSDTSVRDYTDRETSSVITSSTLTKLPCALRFLPLQCSIPHPSTASYAGGHTLHIYPYSSKHRNTCSHIVFESAITSQNYLLSVCLFIQQIFHEFPPCISHCARWWDATVHTHTYSLSLSLSLSLLSQIALKF